MNDYGFATYDPTKSNQIQGAVNSKWPIFGPRYSDIKTCYKTIHISDTTTRSLDDPNWGIYVPTPNGFDSAFAEDNQLIKKIEHGFNFKPLGKVYFTGTIVKNVRGRIIQTAPAEDGGHFTLYGLNSTTINVISSLERDMYETYGVSGYDQRRNSVYSGRLSISGIAGRADITIPQNTYPGLWTTYNLQRPDVMPIPGSDGFCRAPYTAKIDEKYVYIYRNYYWGEWKYHGNMGLGNIDDDIRLTMDYAGSEVDCTIYLCPYKLEDFYG